MKKKAFYKKWVSSFASSVAYSDLKKYVIPPTAFIWHIFSWELISEHKYLKGDAARNAYDKIDKTDALYIDWFEADETKEVTCELSSTKALDEFTEVYVVAKDFSWTYIKTHEGNHCGPYFMRLK